MAHSYEEIRSVAIDLLLGNESPIYSLTQYQNFLLGIGAVFDKREGKIGGHEPQLDHEDKEIFLELFWDLFRQGIITLGLNDSNREFPFFKVTNLGKKILQNQSGYFFHDVSSYENLIKSEIPQIDEVTLLYLKESMQAFRSGCLLSATVMLGVATEHTFNQLLESTQESSLWKSKFSKVIDERALSGKTKIKISKNKKA